MDRANKKYLETSQLKRYTEIETLYSSDKSDDGKKRLLTVYTEPVPKGRPRFTRQGHAYTPKKTAEYEKLIADCWRMSFMDLFTGTLKVRITFYMPIPKSMTKADKVAAIAKELCPAKKPDIDNLIKTVLDGLNEVAFWDDRQIVSIYANKYYSTEPRVEIEITEI